MNNEPIVTRAPDGTLTLEWHGPDTCQVAREVIEEVVANGNELVRLRSILKVAKDWYLGDQDDDALTFWTLIDAEIMGEL